MSGAQASEAASLEAVEWLVRLQAGEVPPEVDAAWRRWREQDPGNELAWQHVEGCMARLRSLPAPLAHGTLARAPLHARAREEARVTRRQSLALLAVFGLGTAGWLAGGDRQETIWLADYRTGTGELRQIVLDDGTRVTLGTSTAIDVRFDARQRQLTVRGGEIMVATAPDRAQRPFVVRTAQGSLRPVGTRFAVRQDAGHTRLGVFEGAVDIAPEQLAGAARRVHAGEQASFTREQIGALEALPAGADAWTTGMLVAHEMPLSNFVAELARYRPGRLACDPAIAHLPVSGIYPLADTGQVLDMLTRTLPVDVRQTTRYWVTVVPHRPAS